MKKLTNFALLLCMFALSNIHTLNANATDRLLDLLTDLAGTTSAPAPQKKKKKPAPPVISKPLPKPGSAPRIITGPSKAELSDWFRAAKEGNLVATKNLFKKHPGLIDQTDKDGNTALHYAVANGHDDTAAYLRGSGANQTMRNDIGETASDMLKYAPVDDATTQAFFTAVKNNDAGEVNRMLARNNGWALVNMREDGTGSTPLHHAYGDDAMLDAMLQYAPDLTLRNTADRTAGQEYAHKNGKSKPNLDPHYDLFSAAASGDTARVKEAIDAGSDVNARDQITGNTALHHAAFKADPATIEYLRSQGAKPTATNMTGQTPYGSYKASKGLREKAKGGKVTLDRKKFTDDGASIKDWLKGS